MDHDLTLAPLLTWRDRRRRKRQATLPAVLAALAGQAIGDFPRVRPHQFHPWCMFLTQLAAIALHKAGQSDPRLDEEHWRQLLLGLTAGEREPWMLVVEDLAKPAFMQPPVPETSVDGWRTADHPDDMDILVTAKGHEVKASLIASSDAEAWVYALVTLQTMQGFPGRGYTGIARMNGGYGNRARVGYAPDLSLGTRFTRDIGVLLGSWDELVASRGFREDGVGLVWTVPWDGAVSLPWRALSPHFIEVCWRLRLTRSHGRAYRCHYTTTSARRCVSETKNGDVGDPWIPVERKDGKGALTVGRRGFDYRLLTRLMAENEFAPAAAQELTATDGDAVLLVASAMARGQGKTDGLHERVLPVAGPVRWRLGRPDGRAAVARRASDWVVLADTMRSKVLYPALCRIAGGGSVPEDRFTLLVDERFFEQLFATIEEPDDAARLAFESMLRGLAWSELQRSIDAYPLADARRYRAISEAEGMFLGCLRRSFADLVAAEADSKEGMR